MPNTTERTEYRVVGVTEDLPPIVPPSPFTRPAVDDLSRAERVAEIEKVEYGSSQVRIQTRTVTETPWVDLDEEEDFCIGCGESGGDHAIDCEGTQ